MRDFSPTCYTSTIERLPTTTAARGLRSTKRSRGAVHFRAFSAKTDITTFAQEIALFHRACADVAPKIPLTSTSIKSDAIHLLDLVTNPRSAKRFVLNASQLAVVAKHTHDFLVHLDDLRYDYWPKMPVLIDWNLEKLLDHRTR